MGITAGSLRPTPSEGVHPRRCFTLRFADSDPFAPPPNYRNEETHKRATSGRKKGGEKGERTESAPKKQNGQKRRSRRKEKRAGWVTPLVSPRPNRDSKHKKSQERAPLAPLLCAMYAKNSLSSVQKRTKRYTSSQSEPPGRGHGRNKNKGEKGELLKASLLLSKTGDKVDAERERGSKERRQSKQGRKQQTTNKE